MNKNEAQHLADSINAWPLPFVNARVSTLGGEERSSVLVTISLDEKSEWSYNILENSRHVKFALHSAGSEGAKLVQVSGHKAPKLRGWTAKDKATIYRKIEGVLENLRKAV